MIVCAEVNTLMKVVDYSVDHHVKNSSYAGCEEFFLRWLRRILLTLVAEILKAAACFLAERCGDC